MCFFVAASERGEGSYENLELNEEQELWFGLEAREMKSVY